MLICLTLVFEKMQRTRKKGRWDLPVILSVQDRSMGFLYRGLPPLHPALTTPMQVLAHVLLWPCPYTECDHDWLLASYSSLWFTRSDYYWPILYGFTTPIKSLLHYPGSLLLLDPSLISPYFPLEVSIELFSLTNQLTSSSVLNSGLIPDLSATKHYTLVNSNLQYIYYQM